MNAHHRSRAQTSFGSQERVGDFTQLMFSTCRSLLGWPFQPMPGRALICPCTEPQHPGPPAHHLQKHVDPQLCNPPLQVVRNSCLLVAGHRNTLLKDSKETALTRWPCYSSSDSKRTQKLIENPYKSVTNTVVLIYFLHLLLKRNAQGFAAIDSATNRKEMLGALGKDRSRC